MKKQNGFTLVELAIALMVIGLLIGGVLKGQELIDNARITRTVKDLHDYSTAVMIFRSTYNELPGNMRRPTRLPNCNSAPCNNTTAVNTGILDRDVKYSNFWRHLERAGLISNTNEETTVHHCAGPQTPLGNGIGRYFAAAALESHAAAWRTIKGHWLHVAEIYLFTGNTACSHLYTSLKSTRKIDMKMDDGMPFTGSFRARYDTNMYKCHDDTTEEYATQQSQYGCIGAFHLSVMD